MSIITNHKYVNIQQKYFLLLKIKRELAKIQSKWTMYSNNLFQHGGTHSLKTI